MIIREKTMSDGSEAIIADAQEAGQVRLRDLGRSLELALSAGPHTFPAYVTITPLAARALADWLTWWADQEEGQ